MKKGLLSLLALALTVVGCQNYDDQFAELTSLIEDLQTEVEGIPDVSQSIASLQSTVAAISSAVTSGNAANAAANQATAASLATVSQTLADLQASLGNVAQAGDLDAISSTLADVQADVRELLEANAVINQNVVINNAATLEYVETLISTDPDDPNVIVNGYVRINMTNLTTADQEARVNAIAAKLATILGDETSGEGLTVTSDDPITFTNLAFIDNDYVISGSDQGDDALRTVSGALVIGHGGAHAPIDYTQLTSAGDISIAAADAATATTVEFAASADLGSIRIGTGAAGTYTFPAAETVNLGDAVINSLTANNADSIISASRNSTGTTITATRGGEIRLNALETTTGPLVITGTTTTNLFLPEYDAQGAGGTLDINSVGEAHLTALTEITEVTDIEASTIAISSLVTISANTDINTAATLVGATALRSIASGSNLTHEVGVINLPNVNVDGTLVSAVATDVTIAAFDAIADLPANVETLVVGAQDSDIAATGTVVDLTMTVEDGADVDFTGTGANLVHVDLNGTTLNVLNGTALISAELNNTATNTIAAAAAALATLTLEGTILSITSDAPNLALLNNTANFKDIPGTTTGETPISFIIRGSDLTSIDLSTMNKVAVVEITGNAALTEVVAPGTSPLLTANAGASYTIKTNSITGTYTGATAAYPGDGINPPTPYEDACIHLPGLSSWPAYITQVQTTNPGAAFAFDYKTGAGADRFGEDITADTAQTHLATPTAASEIGNSASAAENNAILALISATACN